MAGEDKTDSLTEQQYGFAIEQYKAIRTEIIERMKLDHQIQKVAVVTIAAYFAWIFSQKINIGLQWVLLLPPTTIALVTYYQQSRFKRYAMRLGVFCKKIESEIFTAPKGNDSSYVLGWEHFLAEKRGNEEDNTLMIRYTSSTFIDNTFWRLVTISLALLALFDAVGYIDLKFAN